MNNINVVVDVPDSFLADILSTAFEGGSNYWLDRVVIKDPTETPPIPCYKSDIISVGGTLEIYDDERVVKDPILTRERLLNAVEWYIGINGLGVLDDHDAQDSDSILQYALFGEVVFG